MNEVATMQGTIISGDVQRILELIGIFAFGLSGAMLAVRKDFDIVGIVVLAWLTALGGGVMRDLILGINPPAALRDFSYFVLPLLAGGLAFFAHRFLERLSIGLLLFDAIGLGLFTVVATLRAASMGLDALPSAAIGVTAGVGGGLLRDIVAREIPVMVRADADLYTVPAIVGALVVASAESMGAYTPVVGILGAAAIVVFRVVAVTFKWRSPRAWRRTPR